MFIFPLHLKFFCFMDPSVFGVSADNPWKRVYHNEMSDRTYTDEWYWQAIQQYKGSSFYDALLNNPFLVSNNNGYSPNLWQSIGALFGDHSGESAYYEDLRSKANQYLQSQVEAMRQQDYDDPKNQVARMKSAGLNPDLDGGSSISPGNAAENDQPMSGPPPVPSGSDAMSVLGNIGAFVVKAYSFASGIAKDGFLLKNMALENTGKETDVINSIGKVAEDFLRDRITTPHKDDDGNWVFPDLANDSLDRYAKDMFKSSRSRKMFVSEVNKRYNSARMMASRWSDISDAEDARLRLTQSLGRNESYGSDTDVMIGISKELNDMYLKLQKLQGDVATKKAQYDSQYLHSLDPNAAAAAFNDSNKAVSESYDSQKYSRQVDKIVNETISKIISDLSDSSRSSGVEGAIAKGMLLLFSAYRSNLIPSLPSLNFHTSNETNYQSNSFKNQINN